MATTASRRRRAIPAPQNKVSANPEVVTTEVSKNKEAAKLSDSFLDESTDQVEKLDFEMASRSKLVEMHWHVHERFSALGMEEGAMREALAMQHAMITDRLYKKGVMHPPPPGGALDHMSFKLEEFSDRQPKWFQLSPYGRERTEGPMEEEAEKSLTSMDDVPLKDGENIVIKTIYLNKSKDWSLCAVCKTTISDYWVSWSGEEDFGTKACEKCLTTASYDLSACNPSLSDVLKVDKLEKLPENLTLVKKYWLPITVKKEAKTHVSQQQDGMLSIASEEIKKGVVLPVNKVDEEKRLVTGIVLEPDEIDAQNDTISAEAIEKAAYDFLSEYNNATELGVMHKVFGDVGLKLVESWVAKEDTKIKGKPVKKGSWLITVFVESEELWKKIKKGEITGFSVGGMATVS